MIVSFSQLVRLIGTIDYTRKIDYFTIKLLQQHLFLLTGSTRRTSPQPSFDGTTVRPAADASRNHVDATHTPAQDSTAIDAEALASQESKSSRVV